MRCVVEGESPESLARNNESEEDDDDEDGKEDNAFVQPGVMYRLSKTKLTKLEGGMQQYEEIAARASTRLGKA